MKLITSSGLYLTDYKSGMLKDRDTGRSVSAGPFERKIATFFQTPKEWTDFRDAEDAQAIKARDRLMSAGVLLADSDTRSPGLSHGEITMFGVPARVLADVADGEIVFLGAPFDLGTTAYPGCRFGPAALRTASTERFECQLDIETGRMHAWNLPALGGAVLGGARLSDLGDLTYQAGELVESYYARLQTVVTQLYDKGAFPVVLGGDHSITYATANRSVQALIHLDAHCDLAERVPGHCHHHGNVLGRLIDEGFDPEIHHFGLRDTGGWDTVNAGTFAKSTGDLELPGWSDGVRDKSVFVSLDVDVLDPGILPGTGTPVAGGLDLRQLCQVLAHIAARTRPVGIDLVELCPMRDPSGGSERVAIEALLCFLAVYFRTHGTPQD
ncbi:MAG: arginase family protein [Pseudomonadota bacterium]